MLPSADYEFLTRYVAERTGTSLGEGKQFLVQARLVPLAQSWGLSSLNDLVGELRRTSESPLGAAVIDLLTATERPFFRDAELFTDLRERWLPQLIKARRATRRLRFWSAGTGAGQEAYSLAMLLGDEIGSDGAWACEVFGTDASTAAITRADTGCYSQTEVQLGLPIRHLLRWFHPHQGAWQVNDHLRRIVRFQVDDLAASSAQFGLFDVILCSHVLTAFAPPERRQILDRLSMSVQPDGFLLLGAGESLWCQSSLWDRVEGCQSMTYRLAPIPPGRLRITG